MAIRKIRELGDEVLTKNCKEVTKMSLRTKILINDMLDTMYEAAGVGLAAPQVGILKRIVVIDVGEGPIVLVNPVIVESSGEQTGEEGSPQGGNLSPLLANVYLNEFDQEFLKRGVPCIRYADDIVLLAESKRASERLLESSTKYLEERLKLTVNREKSRTVSVFAIRNFKFLGFALGRNGKGTYVRVHSKSWKKFKSRLKELSSRKRCQSIKPSLEKIKVYARGWLNYYGIASMKSNIDDINGWLYHRIRMCIWKQWKKPRTKYKNLVKLGIPEHYASTIANSRRKYWYISNNKAVIWALNKERLINSGFYDLATAYQSVHVNY